MIRFLCGREVVIIMEHHVDEVDNCPWLNKN